MFELRIMTKSGEKVSQTMFETLEGAIKAFEDNHRIGLMCALYNFI